MCQPSRRPLGVEHLLQLLHIFLVHLAHAVVAVFRGDSNTRSRFPLEPNPCDEASVYTEILRNYTRCPADRVAPLYLVLVGAEMPPQCVVEERFVVDDKPVDSVVSVRVGVHRSLGWRGDRCSRWGNNVQGAHGLFRRGGGFRSVAS
ncbi:hypothetical protein B0H15DRAFT_836528 [Mycena belliarum]|uniref:Uncharacterized protein n=1 Tax=Mycena belliarum TaxID=1033014 RepID=A0AAD6XNL8_9AGAR|nr:hypothetical protein B0H15DRAFT_836528 [Mycena belliae]